MRIEMVSGFLLPAGVWLIVSAGMPMQAQRRLASTTLIACALSLLAYIAFGFAIMFGGIGAVLPEFSSVLNAPLAFAGAQDTWIFAGAAGFLLDASTSPAVLTLFVEALPLVLTCAVLLAGVLAQRARSHVLVMLTLVTCGIALPLAGCWLWAGGWLSTLGATDAGRLAAIGAVAGGAGLAWLMATPRRTPTLEPELPEAHLPARAVAGVLLVLAGMAGVLSGATIDIALRQFLNTGIAVAAAILTAGAYAAFTTRNVDTLSASRAMLAAVFMSSAGAALLPSWYMAIIGVCCGLLATLGFYWVNEKRLLNDDSAIVTSAWAPAIAGMIIAGAFVGAATLVAQIIAACVITLTAYAIAWLPLWVAERLRWSVTAAPIAIKATEALPVAQPAVAPSERVTPAETLPEALATPQTDLPAALETIEAQPASIAPAAEPAVRDTSTSPQKPSAGLRGLLGWLRREPANEPSPPQPKKVAYPYRMGGRRIPSRPVSSDGSQVDSAPTIDAS